MRAVSRFSQLSPSRQALVRICQAMNFGCLQDLTVRNGEPIFTTSLPVVLADVKLDSEDGSRLEAGLSDFVLGAELVRLMLLLDKIKRRKSQKLKFVLGFQGES